MSKFIFKRQTNTVDAALWLDDDGMLTYTEEDDGWAMSASSAPRTRRMTVDEAKAQWPQHAAKIDEALRGNQEG